MSLFPLSIHPMMPRAQIRRMSIRRARALSPIAARPRTRRMSHGEVMLGPGGPLRTQPNATILAPWICKSLPWDAKNLPSPELSRARSRARIYFPSSAVLTGIKEIEEVMASQRASRTGRRNHRFHRRSSPCLDKSQQDAFLPHVEAGNIILIGATTENPSFEVISPLLSRTRVYVLQALSDAQILTLLQRALTDTERGLGSENISADNEVLQRIATMANGDARAAYNTLEAVVRSATPNAEGRRTLSVELLEQTLQRKFLTYDKSGEEHYNLISALHKSIRNSDADATLYWLVRMLESGEDPLYIARRLVRMASEDIGLAEPNALAVTIAAMQAADFLGPPEGKLCPRAGRRLFGARAEIKCALHRLWSSIERFAGNARRTRSAPFAQRRHRPDEKCRLRTRLPICA